MPQCFLVCQQFGRSGSDLLPVGIRIRVYFLAVRLCLLPDLGGLFCRLLLDNAADGILLAADPLDIFQILLRRGLRRLKDTVEGQGSLRQGTGFVDLDPAVPKLCFRLLQPDLQLAVFFCLGNQHFQLLTPAQTPQFFIRHRAPPNLCRTAQKQKKRQQLFFTCPKSLLHSTEVIFLTLC